eukprot:105600-Chlamydomonas_euryale.AAC.1
MIVATWTDSSACKLGLIDGGRLPRCEVSAARGRSQAPRGCSRAQHLEFTIIRRFPVASSALASIPSILPPPFSSEDP